MRESVSYTTRRPRKGEMEGEDYFFITGKDFSRRIEDGEFIEWAEVYGNLYGTSISYVREKLEEGVNIVLEIDVQGGIAMKKKVPGAVLIMVLPPSLRHLEERLRGRKTDDEESIKERLDGARNEMRRFEEYDYIVINNKLEQCVEDICSIVTAESMRRERISLINFVD